MAINSEMNNPNLPNFELVWAFMPVLVTCKFDKDPIKGDWESWWHHFFHPSRARNSNWSDTMGIWTRPRFYACRRYL